MNATRTLGMALLCIALSLLTACGGGGDMPPEEPPAPIETPRDRCHPLPPGSCR